MNVGKDKLNMTLTLGLICIAALTRSPKQSRRSGCFRISEEYVQAMQERMALQSTLEKLSPTQLYEEAASAVLGVGSFCFGWQEFARTTTLTEALANNWANIKVLTVGMVVAFAASYMMFLRLEFRLGE